MKIERAPIPRLGMGEGALWDSDDQALYFLDILGRTVFRHDPASETTQSWAAAGQTGAMALRRGGGAVLGVHDALQAFHFASGATAKLTGTLFDNPDVTINDGAADLRGRFVFGGCSTGMDNPRPIGGLYSFGLDHRVVQLDDGTHQSNSHCFAPDGRTLYAADSFLRNLYAYDYDLDTGQVANKRVFANTGDLGGVPDGSTVDADGLVWVTVFQAGKVVAYRPDGRIERTVDMPVQLVASAAWGGPDRDRLYVMTIDPCQFGWPEEEGSGHVYVVDGLGSKGFAEPRFGA